MRSFARLVAVCCIVLFFSCSKSSNSGSSITTNPVKPDSIANPTVYVAGTLGDFVSAQAVYWRNDTLVDLTQSGEGYYANAVTVNDTDLYVAGGLYNNVGYWKNGNFVSLNPSAFQSSGSIIVSGDSIFELVASNNNPNPNQYYLNGQLAYYDNSRDTTVASAIAVQGQDVYVSGYIYTQGAYIAGYWKNGTFVALTDGSRKAFASDIAVSGKNVFVSGGEADSTGNFFIAKYWDNGSPVALSDSADYSYANKIVVYGTDIYTAGTTQTSNGLYATVKYWKNGTPVLITDSSANRVVTGLAINGSDVYISFIEFTVSGRNVAKYSRNSSIFALTDGIQNANCYGLSLGK